MNLLILFIISFTLVFIFKLFGITSLIAFTLVGALVGNYGFNLFEYTETLKFLGYIGVSFLWFLIGLEINMKRLWQMKANIFGLGASQVLMVSIILFPVLFGITTWSLMGVIMISLVLSMSSMPNTLQLLADKNQLHTIQGKQIFSILLFQDLLAIPLLAMIPFFADITIVNLGANIIDVLILSVGLIIGVIIFSHLLLNPFMKLITKTKSKELFLLSIVLNIIVCSYIFHIIGLPASLGAFLSGILLSETIYRHQIRVDIMPYSVLFLSLFFMNLGLELNLSFLKKYWFIVLGGLILFMFIKFVAIYIVARIRKVSSDNAFFISLVLASGGEFSILILHTMKSYNINAIPALHGDIVMSIVLLSIILTPIFFMIYEKTQKAGIVLNKKRAKKLRNIDDLENPSVVICGFGRVGQTIAKMFSLKSVPYIAIDFNVNSVLIGREQGFNVFYGNSTDVQTLKHFGITPKTKAVVIALDNTSVAKNTIRAIRTINPKIKIFVRARNVEESNLLLKEGVKLVLPETIESAFILGRGILLSMGYEDSSIEPILNTLREDNYIKLK